MLTSYTDGRMTFAATSGAYKRKICKETFYLFHLFCIHFYQHIKTVYMYIFNARYARLLLTLKLTMCDCNISKDMKI